MGQICGSNTYYWEGLPTDGLNIAPEHALYHPDDWSIVWAAGSMVDPYVMSSIWGKTFVFTLWLSSPFSTWIVVSDSDCLNYHVAHLLTILVNSKMTYDNSDVEPYYSVSCADADLLIITAGWRGVCDEYATMEISMLRALGIPARRMSGGCGTSGHAWLEAWVNGGLMSVDSWNWVHMDPTLNLWNDPEYYRQNWQYDWFKIDIRADDSISNHWTKDGSETNQVLANGLFNVTYGDLHYQIDYSGPNNY